MDVSPWVVDRMARLRELVAERCAPLGTPLPAYTLFFSVSDGNARAEVLHCNADTFTEAWRRGLIHTLRRMEQRKLKGEWLRVDWLTEAQPLTWRDFKALLATCANGCFRHGLALDETLRVVLTEQECNGNSIYYSGAKQAAFYTNNFGRYMARRFPGVAKPSFEPDRIVWKTTTAGAFCGRDGRLHALPPPGPGQPGVAGVYCGHRHADRAEPQDLEDIIQAGGAWLARQIQPDGAFIYGYFPCHGRLIPGYSSLRHAGTLYALIEAWEYTGNAALEEPIRMALRYMVERLTRSYTRPDGTSVAYLFDAGPDDIKIGGNGLALLALCKWTEVSGSREYLDLLEQFALGIGAVQDSETGAFAHVLHAGDLSVKEAFLSVFFDGEVVFGLLRAYGLTGNPRWLTIAEKAFAAFEIAEHWKTHDHWLSYSSNEMTRYRPEESYFRFGVRNIADGLDVELRRRSIAPTRLEALMAAQAMLIRLEGVPGLYQLLDEVDMEKLHRALRARVRYLLSGFFWPELAMYCHNPASVTGAFFERQEAFRARIDDTQHALSGLIAYARLLQRQTEKSASSKPRSLYAGGRRITLVAEATLPGLEKLRASVVSPASRVVILGDNGDMPPEDLAAALKEIGVDRLLLYGSALRPVWDMAKAEIKGAWFPDMETVKHEVISWLKDDDTLLVADAKHNPEGIVEYLRGLWL